MDEYTYQNMAYYAAQYPYQQHQQYQNQPYRQQPVPQTTNSPLPPWRMNTKSMADNTRPARGQTRQVDSWRSYSTDTTNLQTTAANTTNFNAAAPAFQPSSSQIPAFKPYESLRVSNGTAERKIVETNNAAQGQTASKRKHKPKNKSAPLASVLPSAEFASRYPIRSRRGIADTPLPSVETAEGSSSRVNIPIRQVYPRQPRTKSPDAPIATPDYNAAAQKQPIRLAEPRKLLVILDLNGTLLYRLRAAGRIHIRPGVAPFIDYIFENHKVMIYTSATPEKAEIMVNSFLHPSHRNKLAGFWARDKLELTAFQYRNKVQVYKKLDKIWKDSAIQESAEPGTQWDQSNTILIDDSRLKALSQPFNLVQVPEYKPEGDPHKAGKTGTNEYKDAYKTQVDVMKELERKIEELKYQEDVSRLIRQWQSDESDTPQPDQQPTWTGIIRKDELTRTHLPTPESLVDELEGGVTLSLPEDEEDIHRERSGSVSSIGESVFRDLLQGNDK